MSGLREVRAALIHALATLDEVEEGLRKTNIKVRDLAGLYLSIVQRRPRFMERLPEVAWLMLLDLYTHDGTRKISVSAACYGTGYPPTTALRWVQALQDLGLIERVPDERDGRRTNLAITAKGREAIAEWLTLP